MTPLNLPAYSFETRTIDGKAMVYDPFRRKYVRLTPEEWVRQHVLQWLVREQGVPRGLLSVEHAFTYQGMTRRADAIAYDRAGRPLLMVECKAPEVEVRQAAFDQVGRYNTVVRARFLLVTNGLTHYACHVDHAAHAITFMDGLPPYDELLHAAGGS